MTKQEEYEFIKNYEILIIDENTSKEDTTKFKRLKHMFRKHEGCFCDISSVIKKDKIKFQKHLVKELKRILQVTDESGSI